MNPASSIITASSPFKGESSTAFRDTACAWGVFSERNEKVECREMVGRGVAAQPFVGEDGYGWEAKPELTKEDSVGLAMRRMRLLLIDDGPLYY